MSQSKKKLISLIVPVYNEEENVLNAYEALTGILGTQTQYEFEFIFTDNHSQDGTFSILKELSERDSRVRVLRFNRNYGFHRSLMSGYRLAKGDAVVQIDCDLQDPPEVIIDFLRHWERGHDVVVGLRKNRGDGRFLTASRRLFYRFLSYIAEDKVSGEAGDFRLMDRSVLNRLLKLNDRAPYIRGLSSAFSTNQIGVSFERRKRQAGKSKFPAINLLRMAGEGVFSLTLFPLYLAGYVSALVAVVTFCLGLYYLISALLFGASWPSGFATLVLLLLFSIGLNGSFLAILGRYLGQVYRHQQNRPYIVVEKLLNVDETVLEDIEGQSS